MRILYLRRVHGKTNRDRVKNEWFLNRCGLNTKMCDVITEAWGQRYHTERMVEDRIVK